MSSLNPGAEVPEVVKTSPVDKIIQLAKDIIEELTTSNYTNPTVNTALRSIILTARKQKKQPVDDLVGTIDRLEASLSGIAQSQKQQYTNINKPLDKFESTKSWAQVAAKEALPPSLNGTGSPKTSPSLASTAPAAPPDTRREDRDLIVDINKNKDASDQSGKPPPTHAEVREEEKKSLERLNRVLQSSKNCVLKECQAGTVRRLPSGDWRITMATAREAEVMKQHGPEWMPILGAHASLALPLYGVVMDGVRINTVDLDHPEGTIDELQKQNHRVLNGREIKRLRWLQKPRKGKQYASLVMEFASPEDANVVINTNELFWQNETRRVRRVVRSATINQCFKCNKYGHRSTQCRNPETCGFCAEQHATAACPSRDVPAKATCANCRKKHPAWSLDCDLRKQEKTKIRERITRAEKYWREPTAPVNVSPGPSSAPTNSTASTTAKTSKSATAGQKRPLAERTDNETNSAPKKKLTKGAVTAKKLAEAAAAAEAAPVETAMDVVENEENVEEEEASNLSRSSASSTGMNLRPKPKRRHTYKTMDVEVYQDSQ